MIADIFNGLRDKITRYIDLRIRLLKLSAIEAASVLMSNLIFLLICLFLFFCILLFAGFGMAECMTDAGLSRAAAFFCTFGIYVVVLLLALVCRKGITGFFTSTFIKGLTAADQEKSAGDEG